MKQDICLGSLSEAYIRFEKGFAPFQVEKQREEEKNEYENKFNGCSNTTLAV